MDYDPNNALENRQYKVKVVNGIESITVTQTGTGYTDDVPISVDIDGDGQHAEINPIVNTSNGTVLRLILLNLVMDLLKIPDLSSHTHKNSKRQNTLSQVFKTLKIV